MVLEDADAALLDVLQAESDFVVAADRVVRYGVREELLLQAFKVEVSGVAEEFAPVRLVADVDGIPAQQAQEVGKGVGVAVRHRGRQDGRRPDETLAVEAGEEVVWAGEEEGEAEGEVVWRVARVGKEVARDLEFSVPDGDEDAFFVKLRYELGDCLCVCGE